jgi:hypothetical protein
MVASRWLDSDPFGGSVMVEIKNRQPFQAAGFADLPDSSEGLISSRDQSPPGSHPEHPEALAAASSADRSCDSAGNSGDHVAMACC